MFKNNEYEIVVIFNPYDSYHNSFEMRDLLSEAFKLKLEGYRTYFPYGVLPVDHLDFISNHSLICKKENRKLIPVAGWKSVTVAQCNKFNLPFPIKDHLLKGNEERFPDHLSELLDWTNHKDPEETAYNFGFTVDPKLERETKNEIIELGIGLLYFYYSTYQIKNVIHGVSHSFKLAEKHFKVGFKPLTHNGQDLGPLETLAYNNVKSLVMRVEELAFNREYMLEMNKRFGTLWDNRIEMGINNTPAISYKNNKVA